MTRAAASRALAGRIAARLGLTLALALGGCSQPAPAPAPELAALSSYGLSLGVDRGERATAPLAWSRPGADAPWVYRVRVDEDVPDRLSKLARHEPEHSDSWLVLGADAQQGGIADAGGPLGPRDVFAGRVMFTGPKTGHNPLRRDWFSSRAQLGPSSPDAPCQDRTWDPVEDALALGWPRLPGRLTGVGERWHGARVEGRCNRFACYDPSTGRGGADAKTPPCVTMSWQERLVGVYELGDATAALIESAWDDGHAEGSVSSERRALIDIESGRLLLAHIEIHHGVLGIERTIELAAVDPEDGGLIAAGWQPDEAVRARVDEAREEFQQPGSVRRRHAREAKDASARQRPNNG